MRGARYRLCTLALAAVFATTAEAGETLNSVRTRGALNCGVISGVPGLAAADSAGRWSGFDVDICRALAAAIFGRAGALAVQPLAEEQAPDALLGGKIDVLVRGRAGLGQSAAAGVRFTTFTLIDGQGFLVKRADRIDNARALADRRVCIPMPGEAEAQLANFQRSAGVTLTTIAADDWEALKDFFVAGLCDAISAGRLVLAGLRKGLPAGTAGYEILPDVVSRDQTGPLVRDGDRDWLTLVKWTVLALIEAEESGITRDNAERIRATSKDPRIRRLLGASGGLGGVLDLEADWVYRVVRAVGNYGEIYGRHLGPDTPLALERGPNALHTDGGMLYALPFQ